MDDLKKNGIEDSIRTPQHKGKAITACSLSHTQPPTHPLPARQGPPRTPWSPPSDGLRSGGTWRPCRPLASLAGTRVPGASHPPRVPLQHCQPCWPGSGAEAASFLSACLMHYLPCLPAHLLKGRKGGANHPPAGSSWSKRTLALGAPPCVFWAGFRGSGPVPPFSSSWHPVLPFLRLPSKP